LEGIADTVILRDIAGGREIAGLPAVRDVAQFLASNAGSPTSIRRISDTLTSAGRPVSRTAVESYVEGLISAFVFYPVARTDLRGTRRLASPRKYYIVDTGLRHALMGSRQSDVGHLLEDIVFLELMRRGGRIGTGTIDRKEVDFVVEGPSSTTYVQVAASVRDPATLERELAPLRAIPDFNPRLLLTLDPDPPTSWEGIQQRNVLNWLLS